MKNKSTTKIIYRDKTELEICNREGLGLNSTWPANPPWWGFKFTGFVWSEIHYDWIHYGGPPRVFLTRKMAEKAAKAFRKQYGGEPGGNCGPLKVTVIKIMPEEK